MKFFCKSSSEYNVRLNFFLYLVTVFKKQLHGNCFLKKMKCITHREFPINCTQKMQKSSIFTTKMQKFCTEFLLLKHIVKLIRKNGKFSGAGSKDGDESQRQRRVCYTGRRAGHQTHTGVWRWSLNFNAQQGHPTSGQTKA